MTFTVYFNDDEARFETRRVDTALNDSASQLAEAIAVVEQALDKNNPSNVFVSVPDWAVRRLLTAVVHLDSLTRITKEGGDE